MLDLQQTNNSEHWLKTIALTASNPDKPFQCEFCNKKFSLEKSYVGHTCTKKTRVLQKNEKRVRFGFHAFNRFYRLSMGSKKDKTYEEFCNSKYYNAFVKFGSFISNVRPLNPERYIDHIVTSKIKIDKWCDERIYENYAINYIKKEDVQTALERSINTMMEWGETKDLEWNLYFKKVSTNRASWDIKDGKISPWLVLNSESGRAMLSNFSDEQLEMISAQLDPSFWALKFRRAKSDVELVKQVVKEGKI